MGSQSCGELRPEEPPEAALPAVTDVGGVWAGPGMKVPGIRHLASEPEFFGSISPTKVRAPEGREAGMDTHS